MERPENFMQIRPFSFHNPSFWNGGLQVVDPAFAMLQYDTLDKAHERILAVLGRYQNLLFFHSNAQRHG